MSLSQLSNMYINIDQTINYQPMYMMYSNPLSQVVHIGELCRAWAYICIFNQDLLAIVSQRKG